MANTHVFYDSLILHTRCSKNSTGLWISEQAAKQIFLSLRLVCCDAAVGIDGKTCHELSKCAEVHVMHAKGDFLTESESYAMIQTSFIYCRRSRIIYPHTKPIAAAATAAAAAAEAAPAVPQHKLFYPINYN